MNCGSRFGLGALLGAFALFSSATWAGGIEINPIRLELEPGRRSSSLTLTNETSETKVIQVSVMAWSQADNESVYSPTKGVIVTPVLFRVPPKGQQLVRVGFPGSMPDTSSEATYRVFLEEIPETKGTTTQVRFLLRLGVPLFVPPSRAEDALDWKVRTGSDGRLLLSAVNRGNRHVRLNHITLSRDDGSMLAEQHEPSYVLAGKRLEWTLKPVGAQPANGRVRIQAESGRGALEAELNASSQ